MSPAMVDHRVTAGRLEWITPNVLRVSGSPDTVHADLMVAVLDDFPYAVASHRSAARLHRADTFGPLSEMVTEITLRRPGRRERSQNVIRHTSLHLEPSDIVIVDGIPCTSLVRTIFDLAAVVHRSRVEHVIDGAIRDGHIALAELMAYVARHGRRGRRGVAMLREILAERDPLVPQSVLERQLLRVIERASLPGPIGQYRLDRPDGGTAFLDFAYPDLRLGIEVDGHASHATRAQRSADADRANQLSLLGWQLLRFTYEDVNRRPAGVAATIRQALDARTCRVS